MDSGVGATAAPAAQVRGKQKEGNGHGRSSQKRISQQKDSRIFWFANTKKEAEGKIIVIIASYFICYMLYVLCFMSLPEVNTRSIYITNFISSVDTSWSVNRFLSYVFDVAS